MYTSSDTNVATVDAATGLVTAVANGQAVIIAEYEGKQAEASVTVSTRPDSDNDSGGGYLTPLAAPGIEIIIDGVKLDQPAKAQQTAVDGRKVTTVVLDSAKVSDKLNRDNSKKLTIPVSGDSQVVVGQLDGSLVKALETHGAQIEIATDRGSYTLPASQVNIASLAGKFGTDVKLEDITVSIQISTTSDKRKAQVQKAAQTNALELVAPPVEFDIVVSYKGQSTVLSTFSSYVERTIALGNDVNPNKITTAVIVDADGTTRHVPTKVVANGDRYYARINSLTNSTYAVVWHRDIGTAGCDHEENALKNLNSTLYCIRKAVGNDRAGGGITTTGNEIRLETDDLRCDLYEFERIIKEIRRAPGQSAVMLEQAESLYTGSLLKGRAYDWAIEFSRALEQQYLELLELTAQHHLMQHRSQQALHYYGEMLKTDATREDIHYRMMRLYAELGRKNEAIRQYHELEQLLQRELGTMPDRRLEDVLA